MSAHQQDSFLEVFIIFSSTKICVYCLFTVKMVLAPTVKLNSGVEMPVMGLGTYGVSAEKKYYCSFEMMKC